MPANVVQCTCFPTAASSSDWHTRTAEFSTLACASHCDNEFAGPIKVCPIVLSSVKSRSLHATPDVRVVVGVDVSVVVGVVVVGVVVGLDVAVVVVVGDMVTVVNKQAGKAPSTCPSINALIWRVALSFVRWGRWLRAT